MSKTPVSMTPAASFATSFPCVVDTGGKFATGVNDTGGKFAAGVNDAGGKISGCRHLKVNLKAKIYIYVSSLPKGDQTKLLKFF